MTITRPNRPGKRWRKIFLALALCVTFARLPLARAADSPATAPVPAVPDALKVPAGDAPLFSVKARGFQLYECRAKKGDPTQFEWAFTAPEADLFDSAGNKVGHHFAGPTWEFNDGSQVVGTVKGNAPSPTAGSVPWLLLTAKSHAGAGVASPVTSIQRLETVGGKAPAEGCSQANLGEKLRVPYTAVYYFYGSKP